VDIDRARTIRRLLDLIRDQLLFKASNLLLNDKVTYLGTDIASPGIRPDPPDPL
jgi:hypothetical protein